MMVAASHKYPLPKGAIYTPILIAKIIAESLTKKGHQVTFFAPEGSRLKVSKIITGGLKPLQDKSDHPILSDSNIRNKDQEKISTLFDQYLLSLLYEEAMKGKFDILHIHPIDRALPLARITKTPTCYTLHDPIFLWRKDIFQIYKSPQQYYVSISNAQRKPAPDLNWAGTIYNGIELEKFPFVGTPKNHLLFLGRILVRKGPGIAVQVAIRDRKKLIIVGSPSTGKYWDAQIKPYLNRNIRYVGNISYEKTHRYYGQAKALLCPIQWEEPFGLVMIEAMACGTPVIAFGRGSVPEIIKDGITGFICKPNNLNSMVKAVKKIYQMPETEYKKMRYNCRKHVEENFTIEKMVDDYEKVYYKILKKN